MRIVLGLSGGVDSSVAAALLQERGHAVVGVYLKFDDGAPTCPSREDIAMAKRVAAHLDIPFLVRDVTAAYEERVLQPMVRAYAAGQTPNPDTACNRWVKFDVLLAVARELGADAIATGHYVRLRRITRGRVTLLRGADSMKDQSYFLWECTVEQLERSMFPIGEYRKEQVRAMARLRGLPNWDRRSTRGVCFLGNRDLPAYLAGRGVRGDAAIVTTTGAHLGIVSDASAYTVGQRVRFPGRAVPHYVVQNNIAAHTMTVSDAPDDPARSRRTLIADDARWIGGLPPAIFSCEARIRHRQQPERCLVRMMGARIVVALDHPQTGVAPGQAVVFSDGDRILGGATIAM